MAGRFIDVHELLKADAFGGPPAHGNHFERGRPAPGGVIGTSDQYLVLDSFNKVESSQPEIGKFQWNFMVQGVTGDQVVGVRDIVDTVIEMQFSSFMMPPVPALPYLTTSGDAGGPPGGGIALVHNNVAAADVALSYGATALGALTTPHATSWAYDPQSQLPNGMFTIQVQEAGLQSFSDQGGARHHFDYGLAITNYTTVDAAGFGNSATPAAVSAAGAIASRLPILANPQGMSGSAWDTYVFTDPLKDIHGITLQFRGPDVPLIFQPDSYYSMAFATDAAGYLYADIPFAGLNGGTVNVGDRVLVRKFSSGNRYLDSYMNAPGGLVVSSAATAAGCLPLGAALPATATAAGPVCRIYFDPGINLTANPVQIWPSGTSAPSVTVTPLITISNGVTLSFFKLRLRIPIRLRRVIQRLTNYKLP